MLHHGHIAQGELVDRVAVIVTFMRMNTPPSIVAPHLPQGATITEERLSVESYRKLYSDVGAPWLWWLRQIMPDDALASYLASPGVKTHILRVNGETAGFFETDASAWPNVNLNYFGLLPGRIGHGLGRVMLDAAIASVFSSANPLRCMTVNTCTADHPRALPNYLAAGFVVMKRVLEVWDIPCRLGFTVPEHLRV